MTREVAPEASALAGRHVLLVVNDAKMFLQSRLPVARAAEVAGASVGVVAPEGPAVEAVRGAGFACHVLPLSRRGMNPWTEAGSLAALIRLYRAQRPDLVHHFTIKPVLYGGVAARAAGVPAVVDTITGLGYVFTSQARRARVLRLVVLAGYRLALSHPRIRVVFQNEADRSLLAASGVLKGRATEIIPGSGIHLGRFPAIPEPQGVPRVVLPSRMLWDKGVAEFVEAAGRLRKQGVAGTFVLVGDTDPGNPSAIPAERLRAWAREGVVDWLGWRDDMPEVLASAHVVCLPSYREGFPRVLMEAAACGRPVVATDAPGCRDVVEAGRTGLLVPPRDAVALAEALELLLVDPVRRAAMGKEARALAERRFSADEVAAATIRLYAGLLAGARQGAR